MDRAISQLSEKLKHSNDLTSKLESTELYEKEQTDFHKRSYMSKVSRSYSKLRDTSDSIADLTVQLENFTVSKDKNVNVLKGFFGLVKDYKTVKVICQAHSNFCRVNEFIERLETVSDSVFNEDLLIYHSKVYEFEDFKYELMMYNQGVTHEQYMEIKRAINIIEKNYLDFVAYFLEIVEDFLVNYKLISSITLIVEKEEKRDEVAKRAQEGEKSKNPVLKEIYKTHKSYVIRKPKELQSKAIRAIRTGIKNKFDNLRNEEIFINKLGFVLEDINFISENIQFKFFTFDDIVKEYHRNLKNLIDSKTSTLDAGEILALMELENDYYTTMESTYSKIPDALGPRLIVDQNALLDKYTHIASSKLVEWISNITKIELDKFQSRNEALPKDEENKLISPGFISLLQIIKLQLEPITFNSKIFTKITNTIAKCCESFKNEIIAAMEKDFVQSCEMKSKAGYEDFCIMYGNSGLKLTQYITSLPQCQSDDVRELGNTFLDILKSSNWYLSEFVIYSCQPVIEKIFTKSWHEDDVMKTLIVTLEDFLSDYKITMSEYTFDTFLVDLCNSITLSYMKQLSRKRAMLNQTTGRVIRSDCKKITNLLSTYGEKSEIKRSLSPLLKIIPLIETRNPDLFIVELKSLKMVFPDMDKSFVKNLIKKRCDLNDGEKQNIIKRLKECFSDTADQNKTIFSRLLNL